MRFGILLLSAGISGSNTTLSSEELHADFRLIWSDTESAMPWSPNDTMKRVVRIFSRSKLRSCWCDRRVAGARTVRVVLRPARSEEWGLEAHTMGVAPKTRRTPSRIDSRSVFVFVPSVLETLGPNTALYPFPTPQRRRAVERALARVIAHEVVHALAPAVPHDADRNQGLMSAKLTRRWLTGTETPLLGPGVVAAIRSVGRSQAKTQ